MSPVCMAKLEAPRNAIMKTNDFQTSKTKPNCILSYSRSTLAAESDIQYKPFVTAEPEIKCIPLDGTEDFLVLASDGLTDYLSPSKLLTLLYHEVRDPSGLKRVLQWAKHEGSTDNITLVVALLTPANEIAARPQNAHPFQCMQTNDILENMNSKDKPLFLDMDDDDVAINLSFLKQAILSQKPRDHEDEGIVAASNGKHENGGAEYDYSDLGPETDVDAADEVATMPVKNLSYEFNKDDDSSHDEDQPDIDSNILDNVRTDEMEVNVKRQTDAENNLQEDDDDDDDEDNEDNDNDNDNDNDKVLGMFGPLKVAQDVVPERIRELNVDGTDEEIRKRIDEDSLTTDDNRANNEQDTVDDAGPVDYDDSPPSPQANKPLQHALISEADNVADSEDSEDEWNYYRVDPNKEKDSTAPVDKPQDARNEEKTESPELSVEDNELKIQSEDIGEGIKCESPKKEPSELFNIEISAESRTVEEHQETDPFAEEQEEQSKDMDFQLNPDAAEFVPVSPQFVGPRLTIADDFPISGSPLKQVSQMDDIQVPSQSEFDKEICQRPREVENEEKGYQNGVNAQSIDDADYMADRSKAPGFCMNLDDSEISSMKAEFGDESSTSFLTSTTDLHRTGMSTVDESFSSSERDYDISKDPMAMSFTPSDFEAAFDKDVDLNAVHNISNIDLEDKHCIIEEEVPAAQSPELHPELTNLASPEAEQPTHTPAFPGEPAELVNLSSQQEDSESTFIEHPVAADESKTTVDLLNLQSESSQMEQQDAARSDHSPLTENYSAEFESEKEAVSVSVDNEQLLSPSSAEIDETKPMDETSEDVVLSATYSQKEPCAKEADTPSSISPVPDALETDFVTSTENANISSSALCVDAPEFTPGHHNFPAYSTETDEVCQSSALIDTSDVCKLPSTETNDVCESPLLETRDTCQATLIEIDQVCRSPTVENIDVCQSPPVESNDICKSPAMETHDICQSPSVEMNDVCQPPSVETSNVSHLSLIETSDICESSTLVETSSVYQSSFIETSNVYQSSLVETNDVCPSPTKTDDVCESRPAEAEDTCKLVPQNLDSCTQPAEEKPVEQAQDNLLDLVEEQEVCVTKEIAIEPTPPPSPQNSEEKVAQNVDDMICSIKSALEEKTDAVVESKNEAPIETNTFEIATQAVEEPAKEAVPNLLLESAQESTDSECPLPPKPEDTLFSTEPKLREEVPQKETTSTVTEDPEKPLESVECKMEECKMQDEKKAEEVLVEVKEPEIEKAVDVAENKMAEAAAATAVAAAVAVTGAVIIQNKTKTTAAKSAKPTKTTATKTGQKSTPTSPSKTVSSTTRTLVAAAKKPTTTATARPKDLDAPKKTTVSSTASSKAPSSKPSPKTTSSATSVTKTATRTSGGLAAKTKPAVVAAKTTVGEKKPTANGDVKALVKSTVAAKPPASKPPPITKTSTAPKTSTMRTVTGTTTTTKARPATAAVAASKPAATTRTASSVTSTTTSPSTRPKTAPVAGNAMKPRTLTAAKSPIIDKQVKETANKQISMGRSRTVAKTSRASAPAATTTAKRVSSTTKTAPTMPSPIKKATATKITGRASSIAGKTTTEKEKVLQNGVSEKVEINAIIDDVPKKDLSPVVTPNDNQLIMSSD
ncbi:mucin-5AC-like isoform X2 [Colletes gigas]|uniref:mucin-5AC-like isoform X2 n=1 Tax=Colletes gigas TaxID=935657 RepID=UPI001C9A9E22|nr:mucin-5AC-like isoform X2 [Colletes gigas]